MRMPGTVISNLKQVITWSTTRMSNVLASMRQLPSKIIGALVALKTRYAHLRLLLALTEPSTNRLRANLITVARLTKAELITARAKAIAVGQQLVTIVHQMLQRVRQCLLQNRDRLVVLTKSVPSLSKGIGLVQTRMAPLLILIGTKLQGVANQLLQRVKSLVKVKR